MYRKRMSDALQEARAFSLVNEVMVFKGGRGMSVSKKDLPVFRAKGWKLKEELEEANMKRLLQALQDKLSKEGGAAGFDDLKKTAKTMGVNLTPDMLKNVPGIKQHRDGDYILEAIVGNPNLTHFLFTYKEPSGLFGNRTQMKKITAKDQSAATSEFKRMKPKAKMMSVKKLSDLHDDLEEAELDEALEVKWDSNKQGWFDKQGRRRYLGKFATSKLMSKAIDKAKETGDFINPFKLKHGQKPEQVNTDTYADSKKKMLNKEEVVKEAFSKNDFAKLEATNDHTEAAVKLINMFGGRTNLF